MKIINSVLTLILITQIVSASFGQSSISNLMRKYKNDSKVAALRYEGDKFKSFFTNNEDIKTTLEFIDIMTFSKKYDISSADKSTIKVLLQKDRFEELINAKSKEGTLKVYAASSQDVIKSLYASFKSDNTNYYVLMKGNIYLEELATIGSKLNINQLDFLKNIK
jgi:sucrose-6-phosphate hydrolase SacC (GH32 family)